MRRILPIVVVIAAISWTPANAQTVVPAELEELRNPRITERSPERMLVVEAKGDPRTIGAKAFGLLFQVYYMSPETPKGMLQSAPRARWPVAFDEPRTEWIGLYALPVPDSMMTVPQHDASPGLSATLSTWEYGQTAEILHVGPYDQEAPTLTRLREYVEAEGYVLVGEHEEEYIRGPNMFGPGNPDEYVTILRYRVNETPEGTKEESPD